MTPAIVQAQHAGVVHRVHQYAHDPGSPSYGAEAAEKLGLPQTRVFKTLVVSLDARELAVAVIPVAALLGMKLIARAAGAKRAAMAAVAEAERATGYVVGGISPLGQKRRLRTYIDLSARDFDTIFVSAGRRGLEIELAPETLGRLTGAGFVPLCQTDHEP